jgi:Mycothiol maleylpyruvate isomerase N-terminal domain
MNKIREIFLDAAAQSADLLSAPQVAEAWDQPSALAKMSVRSLAGHLSGQVFFLTRMLAEPVPSEPLVDVDEYYARASWIGSDIDDEFNSGIRSTGEEQAAEGPDALAASVREAIATLRETLPTTPNRPVRRATWTGFAVAFDDFVATRLLEVVIHSDDLAYSVGAPTPRFAPEAVQTVVGILTRIALRRHGDVAVLRALSRAERAPATISAL